MEKQSNEQRAVNVEKQLRHVKRKVAKLQAFNVERSLPVKTASPIYRSYPSGLCTVRLAAGGGGE